MGNEQEICTYATFRRKRQKVRQKKALQQRVLECEEMISNLKEEILKLKNENSKQRAIINSLAHDSEKSNK